MDLGDGVWIIWVAMVLVEACRQRRCFRLDDKVRQSSETWIWMGRGGMGKLQGKGRDEDLVRGQKRDFTKLGSGSANSTIGVGIVVSKKGEGITDPDSTLYE